MWEFIKFLGELDIPVLDYDDEEIEKEIDAAEWLTREISTNSGGARPIL